VLIGRDDDDAGLDADANDGDDLLRIDVINGQRARGGIGDEEIARVLGAGHMAGLAAAQRSERDLGRVGIDGHHGVAALAGDEQLAALDARAELIGTQGEGQLGHNAARGGVEDAQEGFAAAGDHHNAAILTEARGGSVRAAAHRLGHLPGSKVGELYEAAFEADAGERGHGREVEVESPRGEVELRPGAQAIGVPGAEFRLACGRPQKTARVGPDHRRALADENARNHLARGEIHAFEKRRTAFRGTGGKRGRPFRCGVREQGRRPAGK